MRTGESALDRSDYRQRAMARCFALLSQGRVEALSDLYDLTAPALYGYINSIVGNAQDAEDVFQEVFALVAARGAKLVRVEKPLGYMFRIARNEAFAVLRERRRSTTACEFVLLEEPAGPRERAPLMSAGEATEALMRLPVDQREAVVLKIYEGFTFVEIAKITEANANTAASRYRYGLRKLARFLRRIVRE